jgi:hypothetical protein
VKKAHHRQIPVSSRSQCLNPNLGRVIEGPVPGRKIANAYRMRTLPVLG